MDSAMTIDLHLPHVVVGGRNLTTYLAVAAVLVVAWFLHRRRQLHQELLPNMPYYKAAATRWMFDAETLILDSYSKFRDRAYQIRATEGLQVMMPANLIGELKGLPEEVVSASAAVAEALQSKYTNFCFGHNSQLLSNLLRAKLSQNLARFAPQLMEELEHITTTEFPACHSDGDGWTAVKFQAFALRAVARVSGRAFVGSDLNRSEAWMDTSINYALHVFLAVVKLQLFPEWLRPVGQYLVSELRLIRRDLSRAEAMLRPVVEARLRDEKQMMADGSGERGEKPDDLVQWLLETLPEHERTDVPTLAHIQLLVAAASIHTTTNLLTECMFDLAAHQDVQEVLREEAYEVLEKDDGWSKKESIPKLKKLDSFIKEVQRTNGNITSFIRKVMQPVDLSDGTHLPAGTKLLCPQAGYSRDGRFFSDPDRFDALRFYRLRQQSDEDSNRWQFTSISDTNMNFGAGRHTCPGRFFAGNAVKMTLAYFLLRYDVRLRDGEARPPSMVMVMSKAPKPNVELLFRRRR